MYRRTGLISLASAIALAQQAGIDIAHPIERNDDVLKLGDIFRPELMRRRWYPGPSRHRGKFKRATRGNLGRRRVKTFKHRQYG